MSNDWIWNQRAWAGTWIASQATNDAAPTPTELTERCYAQFGARIYRTLILTYRATPADAEDAVQHAFMTYFRDVSGGRCIHEPEPWLLIASKNHLLNRIRYHTTWDSAKSHALLHDVTDTLTDGVTVDDHFMSALQQARFNAALESLSPFEARCFEARMANKKLREIADDEGVDLRRVAEAVNRAAVHIKRCIDEA